MPVPDPPALSPGDGELPGVFFVEPAVVPGVVEGCVRGSPSSIGAQPPTKIAKVKPARSTQRVLFIAAAILSVLGVRELVRSLARWEVGTCYHSPRHPNTIHPPLHGVDGQRTLCDSFVLLVSLW